MNYRTKNIDDGSNDVVFAYRVYHRLGYTFKTYVAKITGPHPDYYLERFFDIRTRLHNERFDTFVYILGNGIYEYVIKRFEGKEVTEKERMWIVISDGNVYAYADEEMNYQYVLYTQALLEPNDRQKRKPA